MTRPHIVRADTLDLQNHDSPSAKDHTRQPSHPAPLGQGPPAPHQSLTLKHVEQETLQEERMSPRASEERMRSEESEYYDEAEQINANGHLTHTDQAPAQRNGTYGQNPNEVGRSGTYADTEEEGLVGDQDGDDDDMMDKISSSPSIDDGSLPPLPERNPLRQMHISFPKLLSPLPSDRSSSSPFLQVPEHCPLPKPSSCTHPRTLRVSKTSHRHLHHHHHHHHHHHKGGYRESEDILGESYFEEADKRANPVLNTSGNFEELDGLQDDDRTNQLAVPPGAVEGTEELQKDGPSLRLYQPEQDVHSTVYSYIKEEGRGKSENPSADSPDDRGVESNSEDRGSDGSDTDESNTDTEDDFLSKWDLSASQIDFLVQKFTGQEIVRITPTSQRHPFVDKSELDHASSYSSTSSSQSSEYHDANLFDSSDFENLLARGHRFSHHPPQPPSSQRDSSTATFDPPSSDHDMEQELLEEAVIAQFLLPDEDSLLESDSDDLEGDAPARVVPSDPDNVVCDCGNLLSPGSPLYWPQLCFDLETIIHGPGCGLASLLASRFDMDSSDDDIDEGYDDEDQDDESADLSLYDPVDDRFVDSGWDGKCLQYTEDIDFEFVYALHTFVATVEGQANATKGDTMVLLDDSNSYWWLVRVVKDGSIGYLPAEHIETPTERLARLNKHRNVDLSQTMLGDNPEKSKNPLKKAMKRRNAKAVTFANNLNTYHTADHALDSDEEGDEGELFGDQIDPTQAQAESQEQSQLVASANVEPLKIRTQARASSSNSQDSDLMDREDMSPSPDKATAVDETADRQEGMSPRSRNGVLRNTDSFFRDDSTETRKITLTPNLLRDDSGNQINDRELKNRTSLETFDKIVSADRAKDDKRRKDKKPGMFQGLFKRKDRKSKMADDEIEEIEKVSEDSIRSDSSSVETKPPKGPQITSPQRSPSKLQKAPPPELSPRSPVDAMTYPNENENTTLRQVVVEKEPQRSSALQQEEGSKMGRDDSPSSAETTGTRVFAPQSNAATPAPIEELERHFEAADLDGPTQRFAAPQDGSADVEDDGHQVATERLSESPVHVSPVDQHPPPALMIDTSSPEEPSPVSPASSTEMIEINESKSRDQTPASTAASSALPEWSDAALRDYMDNSQDVRDLLIIVNDTTNMPPPRMDHPAVEPFNEHRRQLDEMSHRLDTMLQEYLDRRGIPY